MKRLVVPAVTFLALAGSAMGATLNVPGDYPTIQAAVNAAQTGDVVQVAVGVFGDVTHQPGGGDTTRCAVIMKSGITLKGSGPTQTIIDADSLGRAIHCAGVTNAIIRDLGIKHAFAVAYGAGILCKQASSPTIFNCTITNNYDGGIICIDNSSPTIQSCTISNNLAKQGGGLAIEQGSSPLVTRCTIANNGAPSGGGVFVRLDSAPRIDDCTIQGNFINTPNGSGGGITIVAGQPTIINSRVLDNISDGAGGGLAIWESSTVSVTNCMIQGNRTTAVYGPGGGVYCDFSAVTLEDCTITRNQVSGMSSDGGGIFAFFATPMTIHQCTIAANANNGQPTLGGGITCYFASPTIQRTIIAFNSPGKAMHCADANDNPVVSCTDLYANQGGDGICGTNGAHNFSLDPLFCDLANNNYRVALNSPCAPGKHPDGPNACGNVRIGAQDPGCNPADAEDGVMPPAEARLLGNQPNPFRPSTTITFEVPAAGRVRLAIFDVAGREIRTLQDRPLAAGLYRSDWDGTNETGIAVASGVYFYRLSVNRIERTRRMVLAR